MKLYINNRANYQDYREFQEVSKDRLKEILDNIFNRYEDIHSLSIAIEFKDDHTINEIRKAQESLKPEELEKHGLTKNQKNND